MTEQKDLSLMSVDELERENLDFLSRLTCLIYGVNVAADAAEKMGIDTTRSSDSIISILEMSTNKTADNRYYMLGILIKALYQK